MTDQLSECEADKVLDAPIKTIVECGLELLPPGPLRTLLYVIVGLCGALSPFIFKYYLGLLAQGAKPEGSIERKDYDALRASLAGGNLAARLYAEWLTAFLDWIERVFGDAGMADRTLFTGAFRLKKPAPLWTAPAFDRCLLLALFYPIATILLIWTISGNVGPAEAALLLPTNLNGQQRVLVAVTLGFETYLLCRFSATNSLARLTFILLVAGGVSGVQYTAATATGARGIAAALATSASVIFAVVLVGAGSGVGTGVLAVLLIYPLTAFLTYAGTTVAFLPGFLVQSVAEFGEMIVGLTAATVAAIFIAVGIAVAYGVQLLRAADIKVRWQCFFLLLFLSAGIPICLGAAYVLARIGWLPSSSGAVLLFLVLLPLLNAPFDWASLGLTRALLRRGLELGGWWPYLLALADACLAAVIIALLAMTMVIGVQAFDELAVHGGGENAMVLPLDKLFDGIATHPGAPEYWWAYALLLSSMIPSIINLAISGMAFTRGIPGLPRLLLLWTPEGRDVPEYKRPFVAGGLTLQMFAGAFLGIAAQGLLAWGLIFHVMPWIRLDLLKMVRAVAAFDLPTRIGRLFAGML